MEALSVGFAVFGVVFHLVLFVWWAYSNGYHDGWMAHSEGRTMYRVSEMVRSLNDVTREGA